MGMGRDEYNTCVMPKLQAAASKLTRASLGLHTVVPVLHGISRGCQPPSELSCPKSKLKSTTKEHEEKSCVLHSAKDFLTKSVIRFY